MSGAVASRLRAVIGRVRETRPVGLDPQAMLGALPVPIVVLDADNRFRFANHAAEQFLGVSAPHLAQLSLVDLLPADSPLFLLIEQVRAQEASVAGHDLTLESPRLHKQGISVQAAPLTEEPGAVVLAFQDGSAVRALDRQLAFRGAARSVTGMAAILAHEVKNPLSGIRGAAQLLEATVAPADRELAVLIRDEADRIRALVDRMEMFGEKPIARTAVNIHRVLEHVRKVAQSGFAPATRFQELYDPSLPPVWGNRDQLVQVVLNLVKTPPRRWPTCRAGRSCSLPASSTGCGSRCAGRPAGSICRSMSPSATTGRASPRTSAPICSTRSSAPRLRGPASGSRWWPRSWATMAA